MRDHKVTDDKIKTMLDECGLTQTAGEGRLMLAELILKASSGYYNSNTEEYFMNSFGLLKSDRTMNKEGNRFLCSMFYSHSNIKPPAYYLMKKYRFDTAYN